MAHITPEELTDGPVVPRGRQRVRQSVPVCLRATPKRSSLSGETGEGVLEDLAAQVQRAAPGEEARARLTLSPEAEALWIRFYEGRPESRTGIRGVLTARSKAHVPRLALTYALRPRVPSRSRLSIYRLPSRSGTTASCRSA